MTLPLIGQVVFWHWWAFGIVLLIVEMLVPGAFFLWMGIAAGLVGGVLLFAPDMGWEYQVTIFAVLSVASIVGWRAWLAKHPTETDEPMLNRRGAQYVGRIFVLSETLPLGRGSIRVDDTTWQAVCDAGDDLAAGARVRVTGLDGTTLKIEPV